MELSVQCHTDMNYYFDRADNVPLVYIRGSPQHAYAGGVTYTS